MAHKDTRVVFRKFKDDGQIIALFPDTLYRDHRGDWMLDSYMHVGQHDSASYSITEVTALATESEYASLLAELEGPVQYENLRVVSKLTSRKS